MISKSLKDTQKFAEEFLNKLPAKSYQLKACVILLQGDLGSGKTTFVQFLAQALGVKENLTSPTFVLMKSYVTRGASAKWVKRLIHIDAYRLSKGQDLKNLGWDKLVTNPDNLIVVEWPEQVADLWTGAEQKLKFKFIDDQTREIEMDSL